MRLAAGALVWLGLILASLGFGVAAVRLARGSVRELPIGLTGLFGLTVLTWLGGWVVAAGAFSQSAGLALLGVGALLLPLAHRDLRALRTSRSAPESTLAFVAALAFSAAAAAVALVRSVGAIQPPFGYVNRCDDWVAYYHFPKLLLESGGFDEPFNLRRLGALGAGPLLQTYFFSPWTTSAPWVADAWIGQLGVFFAARAVASHRAETPSWVAGAFGCVALVGCFTLFTTNSSPTLLPLAGVVGLLHLGALRDRIERPADAIALAIAWGFVAAWLVGFRTSNAALPGLLWLVRVARDLLHRDRRALGASVVAGLAFGVALLPWSLASWHSSGTPLFPLFLGNFRFPHLLSAPLGAREWLGFIASCLWGSRVWLLVLLAALLKSARYTAVECCLAVIGATAALAASMTASETHSLVRYSSPWVFGGLLFLAGLWIASAYRPGDAAPREGRLLQAAILVLASAIWVATPIRLTVEKGSFPFSPYQTAWEATRFWFSSARYAVRVGFRERSIGGREVFAEAQRIVGPEARIVSAVSKPFLWRFDQNVIHTLDCPGQASPPPGMPFFRGAQALAEYFLELGYTHLAFTPPASWRGPVGNCLYARERWEKYGRSGIFLWEQWAPYFLDFFENEETLRASLGSVFESSHVVVVDLRLARERRIPERASAPARP